MRISRTVSIAAALALALGVTAGSAGARTTTAQCHGTPGETLWYDYEGGPVVGGRIIHCDCSITNWGRVSVEETFTPFGCN